ncbi:MAG: hypothetical protein VXX23_01680, partial [Actinomycetota bacterium]|nr:hypothetical protein [Actinomycetota bacterium]
MSKAKTLHQAIIDINKYISAPSINIKKSLDVTYIPATGRAAGQDGDTIGPGSSAIPNQVKNYEQLDAVRDLMFGKSTGSPGFMAFLLEMQKAGDDAKIDGKSQLAFLPYYPSQKGFGDAGDGQYPDGMEIGATGDLHCGAAIIKSDNYNPDVPDAPEAGHVPVYNFMCTDGSFSRETGDAAAINVFLNSIPTIEMSRCVPYIDMQFIGNPREAGPTPKNTNGHPNIYRFLMGDDSAGWNGWGADLVRAGEAGSDLAGPPAPADPARAVAYEQSGMEVFLSPQTMVNANERTDGTQRTGGFRGTTSGVIDPFRPFMSLNSISLTVAPEVNDIIFSSGQMSITLHDRSRIGEISALTSPRVFGQTWIRLEYGWSHPEKYNDGTGSGFWGGFLNNFRTQECFMVTNSSYTFTATGEVQITLQIASAGASGMITDAKILDDLAINPAKFLAELETSIQSIRDALPENGNGVTIQRPKQLFEAAGANGFHVLDLNSSSMGKAIKRFKASIRANSGAIPDELEAQIAEIFHPDKIAELETSKDKVNDAMDKKLLQLLRAPDPWLSLTALGAEESESGFQHIPSGQLNKSTQNAKYDMLGAGKDYVSIGKLFNLFVAQPLVNGASGNVQYEECQIIY